jgi:hypothetical protein
VPSVKYYTIIFEYFVSGDGCLTKLLAELRINKNKMRRQFAANALVFFSIIF